MNIPKNYKDLTYEQGKETNSMIYRYFRDLQEPLESCKYLHEVTDYVLNVPVPIMLNFLSGMAELHNLKPAPEWIEKYFTAEPKVPRKFYDILHVDEKAKGQDAKDCKAWRDERKFCWTELNTSAEDRIRIIYGD